MNFYKDRFDHAHEKSMTFSFGQLLKLSELYGLKSVNQMGNSPNSLLKTMNNARGLQLIVCFMHFFLKNSLLFVVKVDFLIV